MSNRKVQVNKLKQRAVLTNTFLALAYFNFDYRLLSFYLKNLCCIVYGYRVFPGGKVRAGSDADPSPPSSPKVKNRVELYLYSP
jgi:hypothetical protein